MKAKNWHAFVITALFLGYIPINNAFARKDRVSLIDKGHYAVGSFYQFRKQIRTSYDDYKFTVNGKEYEGSYITSKKIPNSNTYLVIYDPDDFSQSYILTNIEVPNTVLINENEWNTLPSWTSREKILENLKDY